MTIRVNYNATGSDPDITNLVIRENLSNPVLVPVPGSTTFNARYGSDPAPFDPVLSGGQWTWDFGNYELEARNDQYLDITFWVRRANSVDEEGLYNASKSVTASLSYTTDTDTCATETNTTTLPFLRPQPRIIKQGRNVDAGQPAGSFTDPVFGHNNDDIIWRIKIQNNGAAAMQDVKLDDLMQSGNLVINYACPTEASATTIANNNGGGPIPAGCVPASNTIDDFVVANPFGSTATTNYPYGDATNGFTRNLNGRDIDATAGGSAFIYLVGKITANGSCVSGGRTNTAFGLEFGCEADGSSVGGISVSTNDSAMLYTYHGDISDQLTIVRRFTGVNTVGTTTVSDRPVGARGLVTLTITNNTGGTVKDIYLEDVLPPEYVVDPTYWSTGTTKTLPVRGTPVVGESSVDPAYNPYPGMIDRITWENPQGSLTPPSQDPLQNTRPRFRLWSSTQHPIYADQVNMLRHGDVVTVTFPIVLISQNRNNVEPYDLVADLDVTPEVTTDGTDPAYTATLSNQLIVDYDTFCSTQGHFRYTYNDINIAAFPEDLDIEITDINNNSSSVFILTNDPDQQLPLRVRVTNNGGHDARNYRVFASFGATMEVVTLPAGCSVVTLSGSPPQPNPWKVWVEPSPIPATATVYQCTSPASIAPGTTVNLDFYVIKSSDPARVALDDLTFRADVVGEISLYGSGTPYDGSTLLWFPTPITRPDGQLDRANNYSLDGVRQRVIGFNLLKTNLGCNENDPPLFDPGPYIKPAQRVEIGEECTYRVQTGGWFGFETPGFTYIAVEDVVVTDNLPSGQGYVSSTNPYDTSSDEIREISLMGVPVPPQPNGLIAPGVPFSWNFNQTSRITSLEQWFEASATTRVLNNPVNVRGDPNQHTANSHNVLVSTFDAIFADENGEFSYTLGPSVVGYPSEAIRREDLTITEPHLEVVKEVCNESLHGAGLSCDTWTTHANDGDTYDSYIYRITVRNQAEVNGLASSPAYDVVVTDTLDASDLMYILPFDADGLDNDGDGVEGEAYPNEGAISDNVVLNGIPAVITFSHTHSTALRRIDPGAEVHLYYRVDPDQRIAPMQVLTNTAIASYDTLAGSSNESGNQTVDPRPNGDIGGARVYTTEPATAAVEIIPLVTYPKEITRLSNGPVTGSVPEPVEIGEEIEYRLTADLPVARLNSLVIVDILPAGLHCTEGQPLVDLSKPPYDGAGFTRPDGSDVPPVTPVCTIEPSTSTAAITWDFGDVVLTKKPAGQSYFKFQLQFFARVVNSAGNNNGVVLSNGVPATAAHLIYEDENGIQVTKDYGQVDVIVTEPLVAVTKSFGTVANADAADELEVTVTATNNGTANAYNLRIWDDLTDRNLTFIQGSVSGTDPPDSVDTTTFGANRPIFVWGPGNPLAPGATRTFTFKVRVDTAAQPLEILDNTLQAAWTSLPSRNIALNLTGHIGDDGDPDGMRIGRLPNSNPADPINDYETTATASVSVPPITMTKTDVDPSVVPAVGAHKQFTIEIRLPEGTSKGVTVADNLQSGGVSYVLTRDANFDVGYEFVGIASINGQTPAEAAFLTSSAPPVHDASGTIIWNIGEVVTETENDKPDAGPLEPRIVITYYARVDNDIAVQQGGTLRNGVTFEYLNGETGATETLNDDTPQITVVEPVLTVNKIVENKTRSGDSQGGDILEYVVTILNTGDSIAYDVNIADKLPAGVLLYDGFTPTATVNGTAVTGFNPVPTVNANGATVWGRDNGDNSLVIGIGETLVLTYQVVIEQASGDLVNEAWVDWTSLADPSEYERTGANCPNWTEPNDYCAGPARASVTTTDTTRLTKSVVADSYDEDGSTASDAVLRVGDTVVYRLELHMQEGRTSNVRVEDVLDPGLSFVEVVSINGATAAPYAPVSPFSHDPVAPPAVSGDPSTGITLNWTLGDIYNALDQNPANNTFVIEYRAQVVEDVLDHVPSIRLNNTATLKYIDGSGAEAVDPTRLVDSAQIEVRQPVITSINKTDRLGRTGTQATPLPVNIASDTMQFRLEACNTTGQAPAYSVLLKDQLPSQLDETSLAGPVNGAGHPDVYINGALAVEDTDYTWVAPVRGGTLEIRLLTPVNPAQCVVVDYDIGFHTDIGLNEVWNNSATVSEYWSLVAPDGQRYAEVGPSTFWMTNTATVEPPAKTVVQPATGEVRIGEEVTYEIRVPGVPMNAALDDVVATDTLDPALVFVDAAAALADGTPLSLSTAQSGQTLTWALGDIPAGQQVVITLKARVANDETTDAGDTFTNEVSYTYDGATQSWTSPPAGPLRIVEPSVALTKDVTPNTPPTAGDILTYDVSLTAASGADFSDAYDLVLVDTLSPGLEYVAGSARIDGAAAEPVVDGQTLTWPAFDIAEGATVNVTYDVRVLDSVTVGQILSNSVTARWTSLDGANEHERNGSGEPAYNDYFATAGTSLTIADATSLAKTRLSDTYDPLDANVRVGDRIDYELRLGLQEGTHTGLVLTDILPPGLVFEGMVSVNGVATAPLSFSAVAPFSHADVTLGVSGDPATGPTTVTWNFGDVVNVADNDPSNDYLVIVYRARVLNEDALAQLPTTQPLTNNATLDYTVGGSPAPQKTANATITVLQPNLAVSKTAAPAGGDTEVGAGEVIVYTVDIVNSGTAPAYDTVLVDVLPVGLRQGGVSNATITLLGTDTALAPAYDPATGTVTWDFDTGVADAYTIPPGETLRVTYQVRVDADVGAGLTLTNAAQVTLYYSFDDEAVPAGGQADEREVYGPTNTDQFDLTTPVPGALDKATTQPFAAIGERFAYIITVPETPLPTALHDVQVLDDLSASGADLRFVSAEVLTGSSWTGTLVNSGTDTNLIIENLDSGGIDIPANGQVRIAITVELLNTQKNLTPGLTFTNTAWYTYSNGETRTGDEATTGDTSDPMTVAHPYLTVTKTGPATMRIDTPATFTLEVRNDSDASAWNVTLTDRLPNPTPGGMCDTVPSVAGAIIHKADGSTVTLTPADYTVNFAPGEPTCEFTLTMVTPATLLAPTERLTVTYEVTLDADNVNGATLTNVAGATEWFSTDSSSSERYTYSYPLTDGTPGTLDHEDAHEVTVEAAVLVSRKTVFNVTDNQPGDTASPGDRLRYTIAIENTTDVPLNNFSLVDELDRLNASAMFQPGSLTIVSAPAGADTSGTNANGGAKGTGILDVGNLSIGPNETLTIVFEATLAPVIANGTVVLNQGQLMVGGTIFEQTDDPSLSGDEDPTETLIESAPAFEVWKTSQDMTGDAAVLMAGDTLRYTITVKNVGTENAVDTILRDQIPANTTYVPNSTTLNGVAVADPSPGVSPLQSGMPINAPENTTPGVMRADASATAGNVATITFDVVIDTNVLDGTVISNQGFVTAVGESGDTPLEEPSDDPDTTAVDDPTEDVVGNVPLVTAQKTVQIAIDNGSPGIVDPGDVLRYTITLTNAGAIPATGVVLVDAVPADTTYVADSVRLNGLALGPDGGISPLIAGIDVSSTDLTPPLPAPGNGTLSAGGQAVVTFDVRVNDGVATGTIISNQGTVQSNELPDELTDADGDRSNGYQPTVVVVGDAQQLQITKQVFVVGGDTALAGGQLEYVIRVTNIGAVPATDVVITDDLDAHGAGRITYVDGSARLNGSTAGIGYVAPVLTADYSAVYGALQPGGTAVLRFVVQIDSGLPVSTPVTNTAVVTWNTPDQTASDSVTVDIGGRPGEGALNGSVWHDANFDNVPDGNERVLADWTVEIYRDNQLLGSTVTDSNGVYRFAGLVPNDTSTSRYELRFRAPGAGPNTASLGHADSVFTNGPQRISGIIVTSGSNLQDLNLPIDPNGVVYDSVRRTPIAGATLTMLQAGTNMPLPASCFDDPAQQDQVTLSGGHYKFDLNFSDPACAPGGSYVIRVTPPASGSYETPPSALIPPASDASTPAFSVPMCLGGAGDAVAATADYCEAQISESAPSLAVPPRTPGTVYYLHLTLDDDRMPGESQIFNNHIPIDPVLDQAITISKTTSLVNVTRGQLVPYTITINNTLGAALQDLSVIDMFPPGFKYVQGSARFDDKPLEPTASGRRLSWNSLELATDSRHTIKLLLVVGAGVSEGEYVNRAQVIDTYTGRNVSNEASATVRVVPDPTFDCTDIIGKVFDDANLNGYQDEGEKGLPGVRVVSARGLIAKTDEHGRFHITCAAVPNEDRGSNFILKLDDRSLPSGYRVTTENPRVQRVTRGKAIKFNFGAALHRVVGLDIAEGVFEEGSTEMRLQWKPRISMLLDELRKAPSVLRLSYLADVEDAGLVRDRLDAVKGEIAALWEEMNCCYKLTIETEVFWRRGGPPDRGGIH